MSEQRRQRPVSETSNLQSPNMRSHSACQPRVWPEADFVVGKQRREILQPHLATEPARVKIAQAQALANEPQSGGRQQTDPVRRTTFVSFGHGIMFFFFSK